MSPRRPNALPLLLRLDPRAERPLNQQMYEGLRGAILDGRLRAGARLPSSRLLASDLAVSRNTVLSAYERLTDEGYVRGRAGRGTRVSSDLPDDLLRIRMPINAQRSRQRVRRRPSARAIEIAEVPFRPRFMETPRVRRPFRLGASGLDEFPTKVWQRLIRRRSSLAELRPPALDYGDIAGYGPLREAIANYLQTSRGVSCDPQQVFVVNGSQQALDLTARVLLDPGDAAWFEDPGYDGAYGAFVAAGADVVPVAVDQEGISVADGIRQCPRARVAYVTPSHQFPLGVTMSLSRRLQLLRWADGAGAWVIEDDYDSELRYANRPLPALQGLDTRDAVVYVGTFSKILFPAVRIGYVVVPQSLVHTFAKIRLFADVHPPTFAQAVMADFLVEGHFERHIRRMRMLYGERQETLLDAVRRDLHGMMNASRADGGMHVLGWLQPGVDDAAATRQAAACGVDVLPLSCFSRLKTKQGALLLGYAGFAPEMIRDGVRRLAKALAPS
jgi:GntR family transcriptional regulator / MocR family aminotransferase